MTMGIEGNSAAPSGDAITESAIEAKADEPADDAAKIETPKIEAPQIDRFRIDAPPIQTVRVELPIVEAPKLADVTPAAEPDAPPANGTQPASSVAEPAAAAHDSKRSYRFAVLAASVAGAAAIGALCGALSAAALMRPADVTAAIPVGEETLQSGLTQLRTDLAALRTSIETATKSTNGQFAKIAERFDRIDRAQADPASRIAKAVEMLERLVGRDTTGSVTASKSANAAMPGQASQAPVIEGWVVREVYRGTAIVQGRGFGPIEVEAGDTIPGVGRVEAIRKQDSRWIVVTSRGIITSPR